MKKEADLKSEKMISLFSFGLIVVAVIVLTSMIYIFNVTVQRAERLDQLENQRSYCELAVQVSDGCFDCYSSSIRDGGVRLKTMPLPPEKWDLLELPSGIKDHARLQFVFGNTRGRRYDWLGAVGVVAYTRQRSDKWFCSEWCAYVLDHTDPHRFSPNSLAKLQAALASQPVGAQP